jgi:hypothetical protein
MTAGRDRRKVRNSNAQKDFPPVALSILLVVSAVVQPTNNVLHARTGARLVVKLVVEILMSALAEVLLSQGVREGESTKAFMKALIDHLHENSLLTLVLAEERLRGLSGKLSKDFGAETY